jgi:hypothetical protein
MTVALSFVSRVAIVASVPAWRYGGVLAGTGFLLASGALELPRGIRNIVNGEPSASAPNLTKRKKSYA